MSVMIGTIQTNKMSDITTTNVIQSNNDPSDSIISVPFSNNFTITSICKLPNGEIAAIESQKNEIIIFDDNFNKIDHITKIGELQLKSTQSLFANERNIYISDLDNYRLLIVDNDFKQIKSLVRNNGQIFSSECYPIDAYVNKQAIYYLICKKERFYVQIFDLDGEFLEEIELNEKTQRKQGLPTYNNRHYKRRITVENDILLVYDKPTSEKDPISKIYVFNLGGQFKDIIKYKNLASLILINGLIITHNTKGFLSIYNAKQNNNLQKYYFTPLRNIALKNLSNSKSSIIEYINEHLIIFLNDQHCVLITSYNI